MSEMAQIGEKLLQLEKELGAIFPERDDLIAQIIYALVTREHVLVTGTYGTGKSDLLRTLFEAFTGATIFSIGLTKFMSESAVIGLPNPKKMHEEGSLEIVREGGILDAHFVELDELFDASGPLLRTLLGILNERQFKRGRQNEIAKLHSAVASTNGDPEVEVKRDPSLGAVIDRFLFKSRVFYLSEGESRLRMYQKYLTGAKPKVSITLEELEKFSDVVVSANQITDPDFVSVYDKVLQAYKGNRPKDPISDRRACKLLKLCEASALLHGRWDVTYEDIYAIQWGLCTGGDRSQFEAFDRLARPIIEQAVTAQQQNIDEVQIKLLQALEMRLPKVGAQATAEELINLHRQLRSLSQEVENVRPQLASTNERKKKLLDKIEKSSNSVKQKIDG